MSYTPQENAAYLAARYAAQRRRFLDYMGGKRCARCGTMAPDTAYHVDHIDPSVKSFSVARLWSVRQLPEVYEELEKCQVLCADCHVAKTSAENRVAKGFTHGTMYGWMKKKCGCADCADHRRAWYERRNAARRSS